MQFKSILAILAVSSVIVATPLPGRFVSSLSLTLPPVITLIVFSLLAEQQR